MRMKILFRTRSVKREEVPQQVLEIHQALVRRRLEERAVELNVHVAQFFGDLARLVVVLGADQLPFQLHLAGDDLLQFPDYLLVLVPEDEIGHADLQHQAKLIEVAQRIAVEQPRHDDRLEPAEYLRHNDHRSFLAFGFDDAERAQTAQRFAHDDAAHAQQSYEFLLFRQLRIRIVFGDIFEYIPLCLFDQRNIVFHEVLLS